MRTERISCAEAYIYNKDNGNRIVICDETPDAAGDDHEMIVQFSTQHVHLDDPDDVVDYIRGIITDEILPIEFYDLSGKRRFGAEIGRGELDSLSVSSLQKLYPFVSGLREYYFEVHSFSGGYDIERTPVSGLKEV
ncbi:MAG: hypothetical protein J5879_02710 [Clostridia bacterium]|nr:hypothetical protein [Clostridia bacterium]